LITVTCKCILLDDKLLPMLIFWLTRNIYKLRGLSCTSNGLIVITHICMITTSTRCFQISQCLFNFDWWHTASSCKCSILCL